MSPTSSSVHVVDRLEELELGTLDGDERARVAAHLASCPWCARERRALEETLSAFGSSLPVAPPPLAVRRRLLDQISGPSRFLPFTSRVARIFDLPERAAVQALERIVDPSVWLPMSTGMSMAPIEAGPRAPRGIVGFLRGEPGARCGVHEHHGEEIVLVMSGAFREPDGRLASPGDEVRMPAGSRHEFVVLEGEPCVCAYAVEGGVHYVPG